ncbi:hypothetical protein ANANG_G00179050 [Anguilla anguilla]|uniref:Rho family-interacting cell polarization regulator 2 n=1 Tax=Anguilla anguilla TaxID=7936 RepID=A0A9D3M6L8_ANGAN|nr:hypothetical protein ANANG_G00179050 [Anguilla anguilla]
MASGTHSPGGPNGIIRSQSFAGFSTLQERRSRCNSFIGNSAAQKKPQSKPKKTHASGHKASSSSHQPQPKRVEEVYGALKRGLDEYLEVHQAELDKLTSLMKDMKRNSRLGVLYDLDKQIKTIERYVRRLEFHISKVDELYEAFCIQRRLQDGACRMKQAFCASPSTKGTRESLAEVNRRYREYSENMCTFEGELENLLGEFHIKMKGLAGFARLCPGDQYEIFMRYGRQRWKLKGKIEVNSRQSWDGEEMVFMPLITDLISIKVSELKGLASHILVGSVICETKDLFTAMPQVVAVDINDLGTIKLNLEVTWFPFDAEDLTLSSGNLSKATALQRRVSVYSQGTPETPTFQDTSFFSVLPDDVFENGESSAPECKRLSFNFTDSARSSPSPGQSTPRSRSRPAPGGRPPAPTAPAGREGGAGPGGGGDGQRDGGGVGVGAGRLAVAVLGAAVRRGAGGRVPGPRRGGHPAAGRGLGAEARGAGHGRGQPDQAAGAEADLGRRAARGRRELGGAGGGAGGGTRVAAGDQPGGGRSEPAPQTGEPGGGVPRAAGPGTGSDASGGPAEVPSARPQEPVLQSQSDG